MGLFSGEEGGEIEGIGFCFGSGEVNVGPFWICMLVHEENSPWNQDSRTALDVEIAKRLCPKDILQRSTLPASLTEIPSPQARKDRRRGRSDVLADPSQLVSGGLQVATDLEEMDGHGRDFSPSTPEEERRKSRHCS